MNGPKISVIVPVYNAERWLRRCVDSILAQTYSDFELLLINDGSTDGSGAICDQYTGLDPRIHVFNKPNGGASSARNMGLQNARGKWIAFADADDFVAPKWLQNYRVDENSDKTVICQGLIKFLQKNDCINEIEFKQEYRNASEGNLCDVLSTIFLKGMLGWLPIKVFNGKYLRERKTSFDTKLTYREDEKFFLDFLRPDDKIIMYDVIGYYYQVSKTDKYTNCKCSPDFSSSTYANIKKLGFERGSAFRNYFINEYRTSLIKYYKADGENRERLFHDLKELICDEYDNLELFGFIKGVLRYDKTGIFSKAILKLHLALK